MGFSATAGSSGTILGKPALASSLGFGNFIPLAAGGAIACIFLLHKDEVKNRYGGDRGSSLTKSHSACTQAKVESGARAPNDVQESRALGILRNRRLDVRYR